MEECCATNAEVVGSNPTGPAIIQKEGDTLNDDFLNLHKKFSKALTEHTRDVASRGGDPSIPYSLSKDQIPSYLSFLYKVYYGKYLDKFVENGHIVEKVINKCITHYLAGDLDVCIKILHDFDNKGEPPLPMIYGYKIILPPLPMKYVL